MHDLHYVTAERVRNRRTARARHGPEELLDLCRERVSLGYDLEEIRVLLHVASVCHGPARIHPCPLLQIMNLERRRSEDEVTILLEGEEPLGRDEPGRDLPALGLICLSLRAAHLQILLALLLQWHTRHSQHGRPVLAEERQKRMFGYIDRLIRVERGAARCTDGRGDRSGDPAPRSEPLTFRRGPDRVGCRGCLVAGLGPVLGGGRARQQDASPAGAPAASAACSSPVPRAMATASAASSTAIVSSSASDPPEDRAWLRCRDTGRVSRPWSAGGLALLCPPLREQSSHPPPRFSPPFHLDSHSSSQHPFTRSSHKDGSTPRESQWFIIY
jgi:hypothetical protein